MGLDGGEDALRAGLGDELMACADVVDVTKSMECFFTCAYSTGGDAMPESIISMERLRFSWMSVILATWSNGLLAVWCTGLFGNGPRLTGTGGNWTGGGGLAGTLVCDVSRGLTSGTFELVDALVSDT